MRITARYLNVHRVLVASHVAWRSYIRNSTHMTTAPKAPKIKPGDAQGLGERASTGTVTATARGAFFAPNKQ